MKKFGILFVISALVAASVWFYYTPQLAFREIRIAIRDHDLGLLESRVNFPALRAGLKASVQNRLAEMMRSSSNPLGRVGAALAGSVVDPLIDQLVTPETLALLLQGVRSTPGNSAAEPRTADVPAAPTQGTDRTESRESETETTKFYETFNRYVISVKKKGAPGAPIAFVLTRENLLDWKLVEIRNPF